MESIYKWFRKFYNKFIHSVAFFPALMGIVFLALALAALELNDKGWGASLNEKIKWLTLEDATTARTIVATITAGIISLTVFSFSMVMIVMNLAASQMSNRMLDNLIGDRFQKTVLGFYIGTIIFSLLLLSNISESGEHAVPIFGVYVLILLAIINIFLFVYFLHHITQSFRYEQLIQRIHERSFRTIRNYSAKKDAKIDQINIEGKEVASRVSGYYQGYTADRLIKLAEKENIIISILHLKGTYVLKNIPLLKVKSTEEVSEKLIDKILTDIDFYYGQEIDKNPYYGYHHLMEVGVKALSPGINDPGTAVMCLDSLTDLLAYRIENFIPTVFYDKSGNVRLITKEYTFREIFERSVLPIWDYGKRDRLVQQAILHMIGQLQWVDKEKKYEEIFTSLTEEAEKEIKQMFSAASE